MNGSGMTEATGPPFKVQLAVYDLSQGMARQLGPALLGMEVEAIYHTGIIVYGKEHFFGGGIVSVPHEEFLRTYHMQPFQVIDLGETEVEEALFNDFLQEISDQYNANTYNLMSNNCNNCSNAMAEFLVGTGIPEHILELPQRVFSSPMGMLLRPMFEQMQSGITQAAVPGFHFDSFEGGQEHHINQAPPLIPQAALNSLQPGPAVPMPAMPAANPWANLGASSTTTAPAPAPAPQPPKPSAPPAPVPAVLAANDKPLLSLDPLPVLKQTLATCLSKLRALAVVEATGAGEGDGGGSSLLSTEDDKCLEEAQASLLDPSKPLPSALPALLARTLDKPWPPKAEFFTLSLLRPLLLRSTFPTPELLSLLIGRVASPESFASKASLVVALSGLANACAHKAGRALLLGPDSAAPTTDAAVGALRDARPEVRQMAGAFLSNLVLGLTADNANAAEDELPDVVVQLLCGTLEGAGEDSDATSAFRRLLCAGRLIKGHGAMASGLVASLGFDEVANAMGRRHGGQVQALATEIVSIVQSAA